MVFGWACLRRDEDEDVGMVGSVFLLGYLKLGIELVRDDCGKFWRGV